MRNIFLFITLFSSVFLAISGECDSARKPFKYRIERFTDVFTQTTEYKVEKVISNEKEGYYIQLEEDIPALCKGILNVPVRCFHFWAIGRGIETIEPGVFDNQNITSQMSLAANQIKIIKKGTFKDMAITDLTLNNNKITTIEEGALENLPNLSIIYLQNNQIADFYPTSITNTPSMFSFSISSNKLKTIEEMMFSFMRKDRPVVFGMDDNQIEEIHPNAFGNIMGFVTMDMSNNRLEEIPNNWYRDYSFTYFHMANNSFKSLPREFFKLHDLGELDLTGNEFDCVTVRKLKLWKEVSNNTKIKFDDTSNDCASTN